MGKPDVIALEEGNLVMGQPNSNEEVKIKEQTKRSLGKPSSYKDKNILDNQLVTGLPFSTVEVEDENKKKKRSLGKPNTLKKLNVLEDQLRTGQPN